MEKPNTFPPGDSTVATPCEHRVRVIPRKKVPKEVVRAMIATGRFKVVGPGGMELTDWKALEAAYDHGIQLEEEEAKLLHSVPELPQEPGADFANSRVNPAAAYTRLSRNLKARQEKEQPPVGLVADDGREFTNRQMEHIGDAIFELAGRCMVHEKVGRRQLLYFQFVSRMATNYNLGQNKQGGTIAEIEIGRTYATEGLPIALQAAREVLEDTQAWQDLLRFLQYEESKKEKGTP